MNGTGSFPSLFHLAIQSCISNLQIYATFSGLPFHPFGHALFSEFVYRSNQWRVTTEQRQVGIILFAEAYGDEFLGPEYTGLKCSLVQDIPFLGAVADCLVYLDLSTDGHAGGITDKDMAGLSSLSHLRVLNLAQLRIGDIGLSHLVRSVAFGSSGPAGLEYLNLSGTDVTDVGFGKIFTARTQLVFMRLLGIDLTDCKVHEEVARTLFRRPIKDATCSGWTRLEDQTTLFPTSSAQAVKDRAMKCYVEQDSGCNPMQKWMDRLERSYTLKFSQRPDLSAAGRDGLGLTECLALEKLGQNYLLPVSEQAGSSIYQEEFWRRGEIYATNSRDSNNDSKNNGPARGGRRGRSRGQRYIERDLGDSLGAPAKKSELEHMFNLMMYQRVLESARESVGPNLKVIRSKKRLAFVRSRAQMEESLQSLDLDVFHPTHNLEQKPAPSVVASVGSVVSRAKIRDRYKRPTTAGIPEPLLSISTSSHEPTQSLVSSPFPKRVKLSSSPFIKQEVDSFSASHLPVRRRGVANPFSQQQHRPFVKPVSEQTTSSIFITSSTFKEDTTPKPNKPAPALPAPQVHKKPVTSSAGMMQNWIKQTKPSPGASSSKMDANGSSSIVREFNFADKSSDTVNLDRWIRSNSLVKTEHGGKRKVIRFDPKNELFADAVDDS